MNDADEIGDLLFRGELPKSAGDEPTGQPPAEPQKDPNSSAGKEPNPDATPNPAPGDEDKGMLPDSSLPPADEPGDQTQPNPSLERISLKSLHPDDRKLVADAKEMVRSGEAKTFSEAIYKLSKSDDPNPTAQPAAPNQNADSQQQPNQAPSAAPAPAVEPAPDVATITSQIETLRQQRSEAVAEYDRQKEIELTSQIEDALAALSEAKAAAVLRSQTSKSQENAVQAAVEEIYAKFPESEDPKSYFYFRMQQEVTDYEQKRGPISNHPSQLLEIAKSVAKELGVSSDAPPPAPRKAAAPAPAQIARPLGSGAPGSSGNARVSADDITRFKNEASEEDIRSVLFRS